MAFAVEYSAEVIMNVSHLFILTILPLILALNVNDISGTFFSDPEPVLQLEQEIPEKEEQDVEEDAFTEDDSSQAKELDKKSRTEDSTMGEFEEK